MISVVSDASVAAKWFVPEVHEAFAARLLASPFNCIAPDSFSIELNNVIRNKARRQEITALEASSIVGRIPALQVTLAPSSPLLPAAFDIAIRYERSVYDALYVALAIREQCQFVTADRRLYNALLPDFPETLLWIEDIPSLS